MGKNRSEPATRLGVQHLGLDKCDDEAQVQHWSRQLLARALNTDRTVAFVGSGVSRAYGHPSWTKFARRVVRATDRQLRKGNLEIRPEARALIKSVAKKGPAGLPDGSALSYPEGLLLLLGECEAAFTAKGRIGRFRRILAEAVAAPEMKERPDHDPLAELIDRLGIRRYLTTNYDLQIEHAFCDLLGSPPEGLGLKPRRHNPKQKGASDILAPDARSLHIDEASSEALTLFALAAPGFETAVFHCHGTITKKHSLIVSERDYQRAYLQDDPVHRAYREALALAFRANPVVFVGLGMQEPDLLRPLREYVSEEREPRERSLFAILERPKKDREASALRRHLYGRYGLKVCYFDSRNGDLTQGLCHELREIAAFRARWWTSWQRLPPIRRAYFTVQRKKDATLMVHHETQLRNPFKSKRSPLDEVKAAIKKGKGVVVLGRPGAGKGSLGLQLAKDRDFAKEQGYQKRFFATAHFTNEFLSIIDAATNFLVGTKRTPKRMRSSPIPKLLDEERDGPLHYLRPFFESLRSGRHLVVLGGVERILTRSLAKKPPKSSSSVDTNYSIGVSPDAPRGRAITSTFARFLELLQNEAAKGQSDIVITSSLWPEMLNPDRVTTVPIRGAEPAGLRRTKPFRDLPKDLIGDLQYALRRHSYALYLVSEMLQAHPEKTRAKWLRGTLAHITNMGQSRRPEYVVRLAVDQFCGGGRSKMKSQRLALQGVCLFSTPISAVELAASLGQPKRVVSKALENLADHKLVDRIGTSVHTKEPRYTAHSLVREYVLHVSGKTTYGPGEPHRFSLPGFAEEGGETRAATMRAHRFTADSVDGLLDAVESPERRPSAERRALLRGVFAVMRSRWSTIGIARSYDLDLEEPLGEPIPHYNAYLHRLLRLANALRSDRPGKLWRHHIGIPREEIESKRGVLYSDELAWLFNEMGLLCFTQGALYDAYALLQAGQRVNAFAEKGSRGRRWVQSELNIGLVQAERAKLPRARLHLDQGRQGSIDLGDDELQARASGYLGWMAHLAGDRDAAQRFYKQAIKPLLHGGHHRAASLFLRLRGDLHRLQGRLDDAQRDLELSVVEAELGQHPDLVHFAQLSQALLMGNDKAFRGAAKLSAALTFARRMGMAKLEADAKKVMAVLARREGDIERGGRLVRGVLALAGENGMRLRATSALVLVGQIAADRRDLDLANTVFRAAGDLGRHQGYYLQVEAAEKAQEASTRRGGAWTP